MMRKRKFFDPSIPRKDQLLDNYLKGKAPDNKPPLFSFLEFNLTGLCTRKCIFCPRSNPKVFPDVNKSMPVELYEKIMKGMEKVDFDGTIIYSAFCEPLLYRDIETLIELSRRYCPKARVEILTNGDLVTSEKLSKLFTAGLSMLCISMYDGPHQLVHFNKLKKEAGLRDDQLILRTRWLSPEEHFGITLSNRAGTIEMKSIGMTALKEPMKRSCYYPFYQILVDYDGSVLLCTHDWGRRLTVGNVNNHSILEIWDSEILREVRVNLIKENRNFPPCDLCNVEGILMGRGHFNEWVKYYSQEQTIKK